VVLNYQRGEALKKGGMGFKSVDDVEGSDLAGKGGVLKSDVSSFKDGCCSHS